MNAVYRIGTDFYPQVVPTLFLEHLEEDVLWDDHAARFFHPLLSPRLFLEEFHLSCHVTAVEIPCDVLAPSPDGLASNDLAPNGGLKRDLEQLLRNKLFEFGDQLSPDRIRLLAGHHP